MGTAWRREIYGGLEAWVPADWGYGCTFTPRRARRAPGPFVGRLAGIPLGYSGQQEDSLDERDAYLWFDSILHEPGTRSHTAGWVLETRVVSDMHITVFTDDGELREKLFGSVRPVVDETDCPATHRIVEGVEARPDPVEGGIDGFDHADSISVCRYALAEKAAHMANPVLSFSRVTGDLATRVARAIAAAPTGSGPHTPQNCSPDRAHGDEAIVLTVREGTRAQEVFVRFAGCDGHGVDDGRTYRWLTAEVLHPLLGAQPGPHWPTGVQTAVLDLIFPDGYPPGGWV